MYTLLVFNEERGLGEYHADATLREECVPEWELLIHVQRTWDAHSEKRLRHCGLGCGCSVKERMIFPYAHVNTYMIRSLTIGEYLLALVAREVYTAIFELILGYAALIFAAMARERLFVKIGGDKEVCHRAPLALNAIELTLCV